ncbi:winged helix-turn-helix transcriptional regulator [Flavobacteriaceae bacterium]|jgi:DNA-binding HxlR family transcriptional regulator|nr:winged helix-turn-helix transcriptional regulator [Flavobacteriaceae bacterium]MDB9993638.1 winged helix-turn-helix transcriptional regulator [Flavobacteriaceae bacterium]
MNPPKKYTCAIARSASILGDKWNLLILRDIILNKKSRFKDFMSSKEKIATNVLTKKLNILLEEGFIGKLTPLGTKKSTRYIALDKGISALPIIIEMYLFSIRSIDESVLDDSQIAIKNALITNRDLSEEEIIKQYLEFSEELRAL